VLKSLTLWAPALKELTIQGCTQLHRLKFLDEHELKEPDTPFSTFIVNTGKDKLSEQVIAELWKSSWATDTQRFIYQS